MGKREMRGELVQLMGVLLLGAGVTIEIIMREPVYLGIITLGAVIFSIGTKIKHK